MRRTELLQEVRQMRFEEAYGDWKRGKLTQEEAARILGVCDRTFRRYTQRFDDGGMEALLDKRISQASHRLAPVDEVFALAERYRKRYLGWNARHFHSHYQRDGGTRSYTWVKTRLQEARLVKKAPRRGAHRKRREQAPLPGMMIHQDGSTHEWVPGKKWDLIVTMDDATKRALLDVFRPRGGHLEQFPGRPGGPAEVRDILFVLLRPGEPLLDHAQGRWQGR